MAAFDEAVRQLRLSPFPGTVIGNNEQNRDSHMQTGEVGS